METVHRQVAVDEDASLAIAQRLEIGRLADAFSRSSRRFLFLDLGGTLIPKGDSVSKVLKKCHERSVVAAWGPESFASFIRGPPNYSICSKWYDALRA